MMKNLLTLFTLLLISTFSYGQSIGIIGSATPTGWDSDTDLIQDATNPDLWTISMVLVDGGAAKFRQDDDWVVNWGSADFPTGIGTQGGDDIPTPGGPYDITFNSATGEYTFTYTGPTFGSIGIIGNATPGGWATDTDMTPKPEAPWVYEIVEIALLDSLAKFRENDDWAVNWGADSFPTGIGSQDGANIPIVGSNYHVTFNANTGWYNFVELIPSYDSLDIIGEGSPSGNWNDGTPLEKIGAHDWRLTATFLDGGAKLRGNNDWAVNWGADVFPMGIGVQDGDNIPVVAGDYLLTFNDITGEYNFGVPQLDFATIGIIGSALPTMWDEDVDMIKDSVEVDNWKISVVLTDGELKFRADNDWAVNWGDVTFPTGTGTQDGDNITVFAGTWEIAFNATSGDYSFTPISVGTIGPASPTAGWDNDEDLTHDAITANHWMGTQMLTAGEMKFRQNDDWAINWGGVGFPSDAMATQDGPNIIIPSDGMYSLSLLVTYNHSPMNGQVTGEYSIIGDLSNEDPITVYDVKISPNPTSDILNVRLDNTELDGKVNVVIADISGKVIRTETFDSVQNFSIDVSSFAQGTYFMQMSGETFVIGKKFVVAK